MLLQGGSAMYRYDMKLDGYGGNISCYIYTDNMMLGLSLYENSEGRSMNFAKTGS